MEINFEQLVTALFISPSSTDIVRHITCILQQHSDQSLLSFVSQSFQCILVLERWVWQLLIRDSHQWIKQSSYLEFFRGLASFNTQIIFHCDNLEDDMKGLLLIPETIDQVNQIFEQIERSINDDDPFIHITTLYFDNLSFLLQEYPQLGHSPIITHINHYFGRNFLMNKQFKSYLIQLQQSPSIFTIKQLFYMKTCSFSLSAYFNTQPLSFPFTTHQILTQFGDDYLQIIQIYSHTINSWTEEFFACITHLIGFIGACCRWGRKNVELIKIIFSTEQIFCEYIKALIRIIDYEPFHQQMKPIQSNNETMLFDAILCILYGIVEKRNMNWFFRSITNLSDTLVKVAESAKYYRIFLCIYCILGEILTDEKLKGLKFTDTMSSLFFHVLDDAYRHPLKKYKQMPISKLLQAFLSLAKNDSIQQKAVDLNEIPFLIQICDEYPIAYNILWALSFNTNVQKQLCSNTAFIFRLTHLAKECDNEKMRKITHGLLWNLKSNHIDSSSAVETHDEKTFDIMISYSHKNKELCRQLYDELVKVGYRVWIDFDQMHGNVMDAMAQAIEQSQTVIICMSEDYRKSNYCRAEAHYAFQRQRRIIPVLLQKHYKPEGWLLFLIGQLLYVDFTKYEFRRAIEILFKELKVEDITEIKATSLTRSISVKPLSKNILEWTSNDVQEWLIGQNLTQMSCLLSNCNGQSLMYLYDFMTNGQTQQILSLLQEDSLRRIKENLSLIELSCFRALMDEQKQLFQSTNGTKLHTYF